MKGIKYHYLLTPYLVKIYLLIFIIVILYAIYYRSLLSSDNSSDNNSDNSSDSNNNNDNNNQSNFKNNTNIKEGFKNNKQMKKEKFQTNKQSDNSNRNESVKTNKSVKKNESLNRNESNNKTTSKESNNKDKKSKNWKEEYLLEKNNRLALQSKQKILKTRLKTKNKEINSIKDKYDDKLKLIEKVLTTQDGDTSSFEAIKKLVDENQQTNSKLKNLKNINKTILDAKNLENNLDKLFSENETERQEIAQQMNLVEDNYNNLIKSSQEALLKKENEKLKKYNKNLNDHLENERKKKTSIDLLQVGSNIESGLMGAAKYLDKLVNSETSSNNSITNSDNKSNTQEGFRNYNPSNSYQNSYETICDSNSSIQSRYFEKPVSNDLISVEPFINEGWQDDTENNNSDKNNSNQNNNNQNNSNKNSKDGNIEGIVDYVLSLIEYGTGANMVSLKNNFKDLTGILIKDNNIISTGCFMVFIAFILFFINITM